MELPNTQKYIPIIYMAGILIILLIVYRVLKSIGIIKSQSKVKAKEQRKELIQDLRGVEQFDVMYLDKKKSYKSLSTKAQEYAVALRNAMKGFGTDEESIMSIFSRLDNRDNISEVALVYKNKYERDLLTDLLNELTDKEKAELMTIINKLP